MTLALQCHLPKNQGGLDGSTAYMSCSEGGFPIRRLHQLSLAYESKTKVPSSEFLSNVHIEKCYSSDDIKDTLFKRIPDMCLKQNIRLLIIDRYFHITLFELIYSKSLYLYDVTVDFILAGVMSTEFNALKHNDMLLRTALLFKFATQLKWLSDTFKLAVVVVNQVCTNLISFFKFNDRDIHHYNHLGL